MRQVKVGKAFVRSRHPHSTADTDYLPAGAASKKRMRPQELQT